MDAIKSNRQDLVSEITVALYEGADDRAAFLSRINAYWDQATWRDFFIQYISMLNELILSIMEENYENEIRVFDRMGKSFRAHGKLYGERHHSKQLWLTVRAYPYRCSRRRFCMTNNIPFEFIPQNVTFEQMNAIITFRNIWLELSYGCEVLSTAFTDDHPRLAAVSDRLYVECPLNLQRPYRFLAIKLRRSI